MLGIFTRRQKKNLENKITPQKKRRYIVTDFCFWEPNPPQDYNILDPDRKPHAIQLVDAETGTVVLLKSGSIVEIVEARK